MIGRLGDNIISSAGFTTAENFSAARAGRSGIQLYEAGVFDLPEAFMAALIDRERLNDEFARIASEGEFTPLEKAAILSISRANDEAQIDLSGEKTVFILSTTKGNIALLNGASPLSNRVFLWHTAEVIAGFFHNPNTPVVVSNACISGAAAQIAALRVLEAGRYDHAVVVGVDLLSKFIVSGFQSFKALSPEQCRPFDKNRCGLNLGEAAATLIYGRSGRAQFYLVHGTIRNDANHISAPSRTGEGTFRALQNSLQRIPDGQIAFVNAHGTATPYNDAMEVNALIRAGLEHVPVNSLKSCFGHTLGAAGVLESIVSARALIENTVLKTLNFEEQDFEQPLHIPRENCFSDRPCFIKMLAGFGGCNAVLVFKKE